MLENACWFAVVRAYEECVRRYARMLKHFDLSVSQFDVLVAIEHLGAAAMPKSIAERLLVTRPNVTGLLRRLQERGLIQMAPHDTDGRAMICHLTEEGGRCVSLAQGAAERFVRAQTRPFSDSDLAVVEAFMRDMNRHLRTLDPDALARGEDQRKGPAATGA